jgi:hypothetical protein
VAPRGFQSLNLGNTNQRCSKIVHPPWGRTFSSGGKMRIALSYTAIVWCIALSIWMALGAAL